MADYKRFVSYMYEYDKGIKKKNVGYVRVETRNGECRFTIHMQVDGLAEGIFPTYLIHRPADEMDLVYLGDSTVINQVMDSKLSAMELNVMDSGYRFSEMSGILLFLNSGIFYATQWDDKPVILEEVLGALKPASRATKKPMESKTDTTNSVNNTNENRTDVNRAVENSIKANHTEANRTDEKRIETNRTRYILPGGGMMGVGSLYTRTQTPINPWELVERYKKSETNNEKQVEDESMKLAEDIVKEVVSKAIYNEEATIEKPIDYNKQSDNPMVARIFSSFPRIYPFEDNEIKRCVKVEPKDIGVLPSDTWILSNNSFLLHGYYCYHHLIFAEICDRYGSRYILGVPGIYHNRERFMARMFGFECFKSIRRRELKQGDFGYWYLEVAF